MFNESGSLSKRDQIMNRKRLARLRSMFSSCTAHQIDASQSYCTWLRAALAAIITIIILFLSGNVRATRERKTRKRRKERAVTRVGRPETEGINVECFKAQYER